MTRGCIIIVYKIHDEEADNVNETIVYLCLLKVAYNSCMNFDQMLLSSLPLGQADQDQL
jgi:hypothetical protein